MIRIRLGDGEATELTSDSRQPQKLKDRQATERRAAREYIHTDRHADIQTDRQTDSHPYIHTYIHT